MADENMISKEGNGLPGKHNSQEMTDNNEDDAMSYEEEEDENDLTDAGKMRVYISPGMLQSTIHKIFTIPKNNS